MSNPVNLFEFIEVAIIL